MSARYEVANRMPHRSLDATSVAILMCTKNGGAFLRDQLKSIADQNHKKWALFVSDDNSTDETRDLLECFANSNEQQITIRTGPEKGAYANFLSLATDPTIDADYFAFSDQDDVWHQDKLRRALTFLVTVPENIPSLYCGRTELMTSDGQSYSLSPLFSRPPSFRNALVQNLGGGNTMVFNRAAKKLLETAGNLDVVVHDWWVYQLVSACGGVVHYDPQPLLKYRQHRDNLIGSNLGWRSRLNRVGMLLSGQFRIWNETNIAALNRVPAHLLKPEYRMVLEFFTKARSATMINRLAYLRKSGVYRQTLLGDLALLVAAAIKKI